MNATDTTECTTPLDRVCALAPPFAPDPVAEESKAAALPALTPAPWSESLRICGLGGENLRN
jgi:hypothetical protein